MRTLGFDPTTVGRRARAAKSLSLRKSIEKLAVRLAFFMALILSDVVNRQNMK